MIIYQSKQNVIKNNYVTILEDGGCTLKEKKIKKLNKRLKKLKKQFKKQCLKKGNLINLLKLR